MRFRFPLGLICLLASFVFLACVTTPKCGQSGNVCAKNVEKLVQQEALSHFVSPEEYDQRVVWQISQTGDETEELKEKVSQAVWFVVRELNLAQEALPQNTEIIDNTPILSVNYTYVPNTSLTLGMFLKTTSEHTLTSTAPIVDGNVDEALNAIIKEWLQKLNHKQETD